MPTFALAFALLGSLAPAHAAAIVESGKPAACTFGAFVQEDDPAGLNVRAMPGVKGRILGKLPPTLKSSGDNLLDVRVEVDVLGSIDGWFQVANARDNTALTNRRARSMFGGAGWVAGRKLTIKSQALQGHAAPDAGSTSVMRLKSGDGFDGDEMVDAGHLVGCQGHWALVEFDEGELSAALRDDLVVKASARAGLPRGRFRVWLNRICGVQETTCSLGDTDD